MKQKIPLEHFYRLINYGPCCIVCSGDSRTRNLCTVAWTTPVNDEPPLLAICLASGHHTTRLIKKFGTFSLNVPSVKELKAVMLAGSVSGSKKDKFALTGLTPVKGKKIPSVHLSEGVGHIECRVVSMKELSGVKLVVARAVYAEVRKGAMKNGIIVPQTARAIHHLGEKIFCVTGKVVAL